MNNENVIKTVGNCSNPESSTYAFDTTEIRHVGFEVIKIKKSELPSNLPSSYYEYTTTSEEMSEN